MNNKPNQSPGLSGKILKKFAANAKRNPDHEESEQACYNPSLDGRDTYDYGSIGQVKETLQKSGFNPLLEEQESEFYDRAFNGRNTFCYSKKRGRK